MLKDKLPVGGLTKVARMSGLSQATARAFFNGAIVKEDTKKALLQAITTLINAKAERKANQEKRETALLVKSLAKPYP